MNGKSVNRLERLLDDWEVTNQKILTDQSRLVTELKEDENKWFQTVKKWNDEKAEWDEGDTGKQRRDIMNALQHGVNVRNAFVKNLLVVRDMIVLIWKMIWWRVFCARLLWR